MGKRQVFSNYNYTSTGADACTATLTRMHDDDGVDMFRMIWRDYYGREIKRKYYGRAFIAKWVLDVENANGANWHTLSGFVED